MIVKFIQFPHVITDTGVGVLIKDCINQPSIGDRLLFDEELGLYRVFKSSDEACVSGLCDISKIGG